MSDDTSDVGGAVKVDAAWRAAAEELGGDYGIAPTVGLPWLQCRWAGGIITVVLDRVEDDVRTRIRAPFIDHDGVTLAVRGQGPVSRLLERLGVALDIEMGNPVFDERFQVRGQPAEGVRSLLGPPIPTLLLREPDLLLEVSRDADDVSHPEGVADLVLECPDVVTEAERLTGLVRLATIILERLDPPSTADGIEAWAARLARPGGRTIDPWRDLVLWDGDRSRHDAARRLGETGDPAAVPILAGLLGDGDTALVLDAIEALEAIGDSAAVPHLVARLGWRGPSVDGVTVPARAAEALRSLGQGRLVDAFDKALDGDPSDLPAEVEGFRDPVVTALLEILGSFDLEDRIPAAAALGALGDRRALPLLRKKASGPDAPTPLTEACREAADRIENSH